MYFDASERIARRTSFSRSIIEKLDSFLAQPHVTRFESRQAQELAGLTEDVSPLLKEYVREHVLRLETVYLCPIHETELRANAKRIGECDDCGKGYPLEDCPSKQLFVRLAEPESSITGATQTPILFAQQTTEPPWWKHPPTMIGLVLGTLGVIFAFIAIIPIVFPTNSSESRDSVPPTLTSISIIVTDEATFESTVEAIDQILPTETQLPVEATAELTAEPTTTPRKLQDNGSRK